MWAAIAGDVREFYATVTDESTAVLNTIDSKLQEAEAGNENQVGDDADETEEKTANVVVGEDGEVAYVGDSASSYETTGIVSTAHDEVARLRNSETTYTEPLFDEEDVVAAAARKEDRKEAEVSTPTAESADNTEEDEEDEDGMDDVTAFVANFDIDSLTDDIASTLENHPTTVRVHFEALVPTVVTYEQFWMRYYYRCNVDRVEREWEEERELSRKAREEAVRDGINTVTNFFGGAVRAVSQIAAPQENATSSTSAYEKYQADISGGVAVGSSVGALFGTSGRPPFVMDTAVSDADEDLIDEEEEELGWDDDDDYEDDEDGDVNESKETNDNDDGTEQIEFSSPVGKDEYEEARRRLVIVEEERDRLHETVDSQKRELDEWKSKASAPSSSSDATNNAEIEKLRMTIFEKDSELAALKASLDDTQDRNVNDDDTHRKHAAKIMTQEREIERLQSESVSKDNELNALRAELAKARSSANNTLAEPEAQIAELQKKADADTAAAAVEIQSLKEELSVLSSDHQNALCRIDEAQKEAEESNLLVAELQTQLSSLQAEMEKVKSNFAANLEEEKAKVRDEERKASALVDADDDASPNTSSSSSSGVRVSKQGGNGSGDGVAGDDVDVDDDDWGDW